MLRRLFSTIPSSTLPSQAVVRPLLLRQHAVRDTIPTDLIPTFVNGRWRKPKLSLRKQAELRKKAAIEGKVAEGESSFMAR